MRVWARRRSEASSTRVRNTKRPPGEGVGASGWAAARGAGLSAIRDPPWSPHRSSLTVPSRVAAARVARVWFTAPAGDSEGESGRGGREVGLGPDQRDLRAQHVDPRRPPHRAGPDVVLLLVAVVERAELRRVAAPHRRALEHAHLVAALEVDDHVGS